MNVTQKRKQQRKTARLYLGELRARELSTHPARDKIADKARKVRNPTPAFWSLGEKAFLCAPVAESGGDQR
jgi:hypothetical protein